MNRIKTIGKPIASLISQPIFEISKFLKNRVWKILLYTKSEECDLYYVFEIKCTNFRNTERHIP